MKYGPHLFWARMRTISGAGVFAPIVGSSFDLFVIEVGFCNIMTLASQL